MIELTSHEIYVPLFTPVATSKFNWFLSWLLGRLPEYVDARFICKSEERSSKMLSNLSLDTRVSSLGTVKLKFQMVAKDLEKFYTIGSGQTAKAKVH
jgi:B9 domain-containing protein 1